MHVFCILTGDATVASVRERVLRYARALEATGIALDVHVAGDVKPGLGGRARYWVDFSRRVLQADGVLVHRVPLSARERAVIRTSRKPVMFDVDDAIWLSQRDGGDAPRKRDLDETIRLARFVRAGNEELARYIRTLGVEVRIAPTCVKVPPPRPRRPGPVRIGWIGHSVNHPYLRECGESLARLGHRLVMIADKTCALPGVQVDHVPWSVEVEDDLDALFDIGIMPLPDTGWARGKCGYKLLLYMAHGIPVVASPVGVNRELVEAGRSGFLARTSEEWRTRLAELSDDADLRARLGAAGRAFVTGRYDTVAGEKALLRDLRDAFGRPT